MGFLDQCEPPARQVHTPPQHSIDELAGPDFGEAFPQLLRQTITHAQQFAPLQCRQRIAAKAKAITFPFTKLLLDQPLLSHRKRPAHVAAMRSAKPFALGGDILSRWMHRRSDRKDDLLDEIQVFGTRHWVASRCGKAILHRDHALKIIDFGAQLIECVPACFNQPHALKGIDVDRNLPKAAPDIVARTIAGIETIGGFVEVDEQTDLLKVNHEATIALVIVRCQPTPTGSLRWRVRLDAGLRPDITIAVRLEPDNRQIRDYYLLPWIDIGATPRLGMAEDNGILLDTYRTDDLAPLYHLLRRHPLERRV
jgi:hypothetical protein